jgi:hypothetical protein
LFGSLFVSAHVEPQAIWPAAQHANGGPPSLLDEHCGEPASQVTLQAPQFCAVLSGVSHPRSALPPQCAYPDAHAPMSNPHAPPAQVTVPVTWGRRVQSWPQLPQL